jgi:hypothetical protein
MYFNRKKLLTWAIISTIFAILSIFVFDNIYIGIISFLIYLFTVGAWASSLLPKYIGEQGRRFWGMTLVLCLITLLNVLVYYPYKITSITTAAILIIPLFLFLFKQNSEIPTDRIEDYFERSYFFPTTLFLVLEGFLLYSLFQNQTLGVLPSPWMTLGKSFFFIYAAATALLIWIITKTKRTTSDIILTSIHLFITYSVAPIIYKLGFGFDGFIHRATEVWIQQNGMIEPKTLFYIGQYGFVTWLSNITHISVHTIDVWLVPVLASLSLPFVIYYTLKKSWKLHGDSALSLVLLFPFVFVTSLHLTTPYNVVLLLTILTIFTTIGYIRKNIPWIIPIVLSIVAAVTHLLIGIPLLGFVIATILIKISKTKKIQIPLLVLYTCGIALIPASMFAVYLKLGGHGFPVFLNPFEHIGKFIELFKRPFWYRQESPILFELLYLWQRLIVPIVIGFGIIGFFVKKQKRVVEYIFPLTTIGFWIAAWLLRTWIIFPDVISQEQGGYPTRLLVVGLLFLIPWSMYGIYYIGKSLTEEITSIPKKGWMTIFVISSSLLLMVSLYFSYPQRNPKVYFTGFNVTEHDVSAAEWIDADNEEYNYVVLANSITSVAAMTKYSFIKHFQTDLGELYYYSIPTGGPLYKIYQNMLYEGQKREYMNEAMELTNTNKSYFVVNWYWDNFDKIVEGAKQSADSWEIINDKIWIFTYTR